MSLQPVARVGDPGGHGMAQSGYLAAPGSPTRSADGIAVCRVGDTYVCGIHGPNPMVTGSASQTADGAAVCRVGDSSLCGAQIISGSPTDFSS